jgi:hypothetical protein
MGVTPSATSRHEKELLQTAGTVGESLSQAGPLETTPAVASDETGSTPPYLSQTTAIIAEVQVRSLNSVLSAFTESSLNDQLMDTEEQIVAPAAPAVTPVPSLLVAGESVMYTAPMKVNIQAKITKLAAALEKVRPR